MNYAKRLSNTTKLDDDSIMPITKKYKGMRLGEVPDDFWHWFLKQDWCDQWPDLVQYANHVVED